MPISSFWDDSSIIGMTITIKTPHVMLPSLVRAANRPLSLSKLGVQHSSLSYGATLDGCGHTPWKARYFRLGARV